MQFLRGSAPVWLWSAVVGLALAASACGGDDDDDGGGATNGPTGAECPDDSDLTYDTFASDFFSEYCLGCHSSDNSGSARMGAPEGVNFDTLEGIQDHADEIDMRAAAGPDATNRIMPPQGGPSDAEREQLGEWLACGAPE